MIWMVFGRMGRWRVSEDYSAEECGPYASGGRRRNEL
jgi:hypothetical protein